MMSVMSAGNGGGVVSPSHWGISAAEEEKTVASTSVVDWAGDSGIRTVRSTEEAARDGGDGPDARRISDNASDPRVSNLENGSDAGGAGNRLGSTVSELHGNSKKSGSWSGNPDRKKNWSAVGDYNSMLSAFDDFASVGKDEAVGNGFKIGDMVWGKVKSHPWWPGFIYNEAFATASVRRDKQRGYVLVAFFGDSSYGWFDPSELIPFEENFVEKSKQHMSRSSFIRAVEEAIDEVSRRSSVGLACRCRNEFNFWPSNVKGYFNVSAGNYEPGVYGLSQINKARERFKEREMLSFVQLMALEPRNYENWSIDFIQNKAIVLAYRKTQFEEYDDTYAQAFGNVLERPPRPTAPVAVDASKAPLSGRLVFADTLGNGEISVKSTKTKGLVEKDKYLFKRRDESIQVKIKKGSLGHTTHLISVDGHYSGVRGHMSIADSQLQPISSNIRPSEGLRKQIEGGVKNVKAPRQPAGEFIAVNAKSLKKKKKRISTETGVKSPRESSLGVINRVVAVENVPRMPPVVQFIDDNKLGNQKKDTVASLSSSQSHQEVGFAEVELRMLMRDLCFLALNPLHGAQRSCPAVIKEVFLKFRSLAYQKSLLLVQSPENETIECYMNILPTHAVSDGNLEKTKDKIVRPSIRLEDPTKGGKKRGPSDRPGNVKKNKLDILEGVKRKKVEDSFDTKKKKVENNKVPVERKTILRPTEPLRGDLPPPKAVKLEASKRAESMARFAKPTMLVMKFPAGAALPSSFELKAKFARFGPFDESATRIFWKTYTCRMVYLHKIDAQAALNAVESSNLFGSTSVRCFLREMEGEAVEAEAASKLQKEDSAHPTKVHKMAPKIDPQELKSCLKKQTGDEGGGRGSRVKFVLENVSNKGEVVVNKNKNSKVDEGGSSVVHSLDLSSKILGTKLKPQSTSSFIKFPVAIAPPEEGSRTPEMKMNNDVSQQMLNLLTRCNEVVNNLKATWGYMPYHAL